MSAPVVYTYSGCATCRRAVKWLRAEGIEFREKAIRETPPSRAELQHMLTAVGGDLRRLFNTSGKDYREQKLSALLPAMSVADALGRLHGNGNLVKRPFLIDDGLGLVGFDEAEWRQALG